MIFRTLLFFILLYYLIKMIGRFFLSPEERQRRTSGFNFFYGGTNGNTGSRRSKRPENLRDRIDQIEEAEFEDVTDDAKSKDTD